MLKFQVLIGIIPLNLGFKIHSAFSTFPIALYEGPEEQNAIEAITKTFCNDLQLIEASGITINGNKHSIEKIISCDLKTLWTLTDRK
jgi:hypothetical protein